RAQGATAPRWISGMESQRLADRTDQHRGTLIMLGGRLAWYFAGPPIGLFIVGVRATPNKPFGALGGYIEMTETALLPSRFGFRGYLLLGLALGGFLYATLTGAWAPSLSVGGDGGLLPETPPGQLALLFAAGLAMGYGARTAGGCTSGHGMCGMSLLSP